MTYTVSDVFTRIQRTFGDEASIQVSESDIIRWINDAQNEAVQQSEGLLMKEGTIASVANQKEYDLPTDCFTLHHVMYKDTPTAAYYTLKWSALPELNNFADGWDGSSIISYPMIYSSTRAGKLFLFPEPEASVANGIKLIYARYATDLVNSGSTIDLPQYLHNYVVRYCMMEAYKMDEDWEAVDRMASQVQSDLDFNNNREFWFGRETYPTLSTRYEDFD